MLNYSSKSNKIVIFRSNYDLELNFGHRIKYHCLIHKNITKNQDSGLKLFD